MDSNRYEHTQNSPLWILLLLLAVMFFVVSGSIEEVWANWLMRGAGVIVVGLTTCFAYLRVAVDGDELKITYGPLPLFRQRLSLTDIVSAEPGRSKLIDGFGIHWVPTRGWTYNLWGFECVELKLRQGQRFRVGTNDSEELASFLRSSIQAA